MQRYAFMENRSLSQQMQKIGKTEKWMNLWVEISLSYWHFAVFNARWRKRRFANVTFALLAVDSLWHAIMERAQKSAVRP